MASQEYTHLTLTGYYAGRTLCGAAKSPNVAHYHAMYAPLTIINADTTCPNCREIWNDDTDELLLEDAITAATP